MSLAIKSDTIKEKCDHSEGWLKVDLDHVRLCARFE